MQAPVAPYVRPGTRTACLAVQGCILACLVFPTSVYGQEAGVRPTPATVLSDATAPVDVLAADAVLQEVFRSGLPDDPANVETAYEALISQAESALTGGEAAVIRRHVAQLALVLSDEVLGQVINENRTEPPFQWTFRPGAGVHLAAWWRSQDPQPATPENERMREHLERLAHATRQFAAEERDTGLDERGETYVRFGAPTRRLTIQFSDGEFMREVFRFGIHLSLRDFPENEIWTYPHIDQTGYFLFVKDGDYFRIGATEDLLPKKLSGGVNGSARGMNMAYSLLAALRYVYGQLALIHADFSGRYTQVEHYAMWQEEQQIVYETGHIPAQTGVEQQAIGQGGAGQVRFIFSNPLMGIDPVDQFANSLLTRSKREDQEATVRRNDLMPISFSAATPDQTFPVMLRTARFLADDGTTRTDIYWAPEPGAFRLTDEAKQGLQTLGHVRYDRHLLQVTASHQTGDYREREVVQKAYLLNGDVREDTAAALPPLTLTVEGDTGLYHVAVQWDAYLVRLREAEKQFDAGPRLRMTVHRLDSLEALRSDEAILEMSDLRPATAALAGDTTFDPLNPSASTPYPSTSISAATPLALYFEVYHLAYGADDKTHYNVEYEITREGQQGVLARIFRPDEPDVTAASTYYTGQNRTAREYVFVDLSDTAGGGALHIRVRVTDEVTGQTVARQIHFYVTP